MVTAEPEVLVSSTKSPPAPCVRYWLITTLSSSAAPRADVVNDPYGGPLVKVPFCVVTTSRKTYPLDGSRSVSGAETATLSVPVGVVVQGAWRPKAAVLP